MKNSLMARVEFSFKGLDYDLNSNLDLDVLLSARLNELSIHSLLAREHKIDPISYLYEVMLETDIEFSNAQGLASAFLHGTQFDMAGFTRSWQEQQFVKLLQPLALRELQIADLDAHPDIKNALVQAYKLGKGL
jgi:hypothetical protein